jgi:hypothetical protein
MRRLKKHLRLCRPLKRCLAAYRRSELLANLQDPAATITCFNGEVSFTVAFLSKFINAVVITSTQDLLA